MSIDTSGTRTPRPALFVGSSSEGLRIAQTVQLLLDHTCEVTLWTQGLVDPSRGTLESLVRAAPGFDFAVLVLTADDLNITRGSCRAAARDNVLMEVGLFAAALGCDRVFILFDRANRPTLPTDLAGITPVTYEPHVTGNLVSALGASCTIVQNVVEKLGIRPAQTGLKTCRPPRDPSRSRATARSLNGSRSAHHKPRP
jgi:predicted nucleotide-binding protein